MPSERDVSLLRSVSVTVELSLAEAIAVEAAAVLAHKLALVDGRELAMEGDVLAAAAKLREAVDARSRRAS